MHLIKEVAIYLQHEILSCILRDDKAACCFWLIFGFCYCFGILYLLLYPWSAAAAVAACGDVGDGHPAVHRSPRRRRARVLLSSDSAR